MQYRKTWIVVCAAGFLLGILVVVGWWMVAGELAGEAYIEPTATETPQAVVVDNPYKTSITSVSVTMNTLDTLSHNKPVDFTVTISRIAPGSQTSVPYISFKSSSGKPMTYGRYDDNGTTIHWTQNGVKETVID